MAVTSGTEMNAPGGKRAASDEESLAALRSTWHAAYVIPEPRRHLMWWRTWTAWRRDTAGPPLTARDAAALTGHRRGLDAADPAGTCPARRCPVTSEQLLRLAAFRRSHPHVIVGRAEFRGGWEATIPMPRDGLGYFAPRPLGDLLDALEEELHSAPP